MDKNTLLFTKDCEIGMKGNKKICILTFTESDDMDEIRNLTLKHMDEKNHIPLTHGKILVLNSKLQSFYRHGIKKSNASTRRISLSFRQFEA
jgi:hypothetical protein